jgi:hypothetical protein
MTTDVLPRRVSLDFAGTRADWNAGDRALRPGGRRAYWYVIRSGTGPSASTSAGENRLTSSS